VKPVIRLERWRGVRSVAFALALGVTTPAGHVATASAPPVRHVFVIVLENQSFEGTFGAHASAPYLARTLVAQGALLKNYFGIGHMSLDNYVALISGQAPNKATQLDCPTYTPFQLTQPTLNADGLALGTGCLYPRMVQMVGDQLDAAGFSWRGYMEDLGRDPARDGGPCGHPAIGAPDPTQTAKRTPKDQYAMWHNPFVFFRTVVDDPSRCASHVVGLDRLANDLATTATTPNYAFITPNLCDDAHDTPCMDDSPGGLEQADRFLRHWVPIITGSPAFKADGVLIITFDEAESTTEPDTSAACCGERGLPGAATPPGGDGPGGGRVGAVILSSFIKGGTVSTTPYNHYALLRWVEDVFGLPHLGYAGAPGLRGFGADVFGNTARTD
jgi:phosphatidylinositol-3-phosphatase